jgi:[ribosomal protein S5]-alanine N-acetyltransferase
MNSTFILSTPQLDLVLQTPTETLVWAESLPPEVQVEVSPDWIERVKNTQPGNVWALGFLMIERASGANVGSCAFKGPPNADGAVEIAYGVDEPHRRRGFATQAAEALTTYALENELVQVVIAHTRETNDASARTLAKCGFTRIGEVIDPEDGPVIRWERHRD